ncbi:unnamed protein product [Mytilus coruscus]|uniref:Ig-like domain-containing protein n=1 Tax=Mytilus coruscus TaxID=42192 RepID=A0A6J8DZ17_MYTCO|nr:unnamed protein product [Mytilus coruscus]
MTQTFTVQFRNSPDLGVLFVHHDDKIKVLELWNRRNLSCGEWDSRKAYRNVYIDHVGLDCIKKLTVRIFKKDDKQLVLEYSNITSKKLEDYLRSKPDRATSDTWNDTRVPLPTDKYLVNEGNYEFRWLNQNGDRIFAALYYDSSADKFPKFYYSKEKEGAENTEPDTQDHSDMEDCHDIRVSFTVKIMLYHTLLSCCCLSSLFDSTKPASDQGWCQVNSGSEGNYEFRWLNQNGDRIFAALYYDSSADKFPKFYYSKKEEGGENTQPDKKDHSGMEDCHDIKVTFTVQSIAKCITDNVYNSIHLAKCPDLKPPTVTSIDTTYTIDIETDIAINCKHDANKDPVTKVEWLFKNTLNSYGVQYFINTELAKYGGSTVASPSLIIYNFMPEDIGKYT